MRRFIKILQKYSPMFVIFLASLMSFWRAYNLSFTHDEALTVNFFVPKPYEYILGIEKNVSGLYANNHPLNTVLIKLSSSLFGVSEISARLPALIGQIMYLVAGYFLVNFLFSQWWKKIVALSFLAFHPFLIDYFSAARGYALSLGLLAAGITFMAYSISEPINRNFRWNEIGLFLSALSATNNLNFIHVFFALLFCFFFITFKIYRKKPNNLASFLKGIVIAIIPLLLVYSRNFWEAYKTGAFYVGGIEGFWKDTLLSVIRITTYRFEPNISYQILKIIFLTVVGVGFWIIYKTRRSILLFLAIIPILTVSSIYFSFKLAHIEVPVERGSIYLILLFSLFLLSVWSSVQFKNRLAEVVIIGLVLFITSYYFTAIQFTYYYTWPYDRHTKEVFNMIIEDYRNSGRDGSITIGATWLFEPSLNFYRSKSKTNFIEPVTRETTNGSYTYYYVLSNFNNHGIIENMEDIRAKYNLEILKHFNDINSFLLVAD